MTENAYLKSGGLVSKIVAMEKISNSWFFKFLFLLFWIFGLGFAALLIASYLPNQWQANALSFRGLAFIVLALFLTHLAFRGFFQKSLCRFPLTSPEKAKEILSAKGKINLADTLSLSLSEALLPLFSKSGADISLKELGKNLCRAKDMNFIILRLGLGLGDIEESLEEERGSLIPLFSKAVDLAIQNGHPSVWSGDLFLAFCQHSQGLARLLRDLHLDLSDIENVVIWQTKVFESVEKNRGIFNANNLKKTGGIGKDWAFGFTNYLKHFSEDLTEAIRNHGLAIEVVGRNKEISQIEEALSRQTSANVIIVGDAGVGKHTTVLGFAKKVLEGEISDKFAHSTIYQIDTEALMSGVSGEGEVIQRFSRVLEEASYAGNVIVVIENIDNIFSSQGVGTVNLTEILLPYLSNSSIHIIGTSETEPYNEFILANNALAQRFVRVSISEPKEDDLLKILEDSAPMIEYSNGSIITFEAIKAAMKNAGKYMVNLTNPEKSIGLLEGAATKATSERGKTIVLPKDIEEYISEKYEIPSAEAGEDEKAKLLDLEKIMHETVIGQDEAVKAIANAMRRARSQVSDSRKPIGSFLFLGPTGVGKTATAKALARAYFGSAENMIRFDMSEYQNTPDIYRLIGSGDEPGNLTTFVTEKPFSLLLFDEIEKCNPEILNLFLQIFDEGILTDGRGKKVIFNNTIIIATSNAGSDLIRESINRGEDYEKVKKVLSDYMIESNIFRPELLNRFTGVVAFSPLAQEQIKQVAGLVIDRMEKTVFENKGVTVQVASDALDLLSQLGFDPKMGARPMERVIQEKIENLLAEKILKGELKKGDSISITKEMIK